MSKKENRPISDHLCECGCGQYTYYALKTKSAMGHVKGEPLRFLQSHSLINKGPPDGAVCGIENCDLKAYGQHGLCKQHYRRKKNNPHADMSRSLTIRKRGTGSINESGYKIITVNNKRVREHRHIMEQYLKRPLLPTETVHHINNDKLDNRLENLELWSSRHPTGSRAVDQLEEAKNIIRQYRKEYKEMFPD